MLAARTVPDPSGRMSWNLTAPAGVGPTPVTVAVNVTGWPTVLGEPDVVSVTVETNLFTCWETVPLLLRLLPSPLYVAVIVWLPAASAALAAAWPLVSGTLAARRFAPSLKVTV